MMVMTLTWRVGHDEELVFLLDDIDGAKIAERGLLGVAVAAAGEGLQPEVPQVRRRPVEQVVVARNRHGDDGTR